tara:strand:+ start:277 stop:1272 length:996 start_codon:yes stop_codon:yes gene_type:complete
MVMIFVMSTLLIGYTPPVAQGASVVITDAVQIVDGGAVNERMASMTSDSEGNIHVVWSRNTQHLYYSMLDPRAQTVIDVTQISNGGGHRAWHPDIDIDSDDRIHIVWANKASQHEILYTLLDPSLDDQDGSTADDSTISIIDDTEVTRRQQNRDWPAIAVDSQNNAHIVWEDSYDRHDKYFQQPQIYYKFLEIDEASREAITAIDSTLLTPIIGHKGHPDIAIDADDLVQIAWDDTRVERWRLYLRLTHRVRCILNGLTCAWCSTVAHGQTVVASKESNPCFRKRIFQSLRPSMHSVGFTQVPRQVALAQTNHITRIHEPTISILATILVA